MPREWVHLPSPWHACWCWDSSWSFEMTFLIGMLQLELGILDGIFTHIMCMVWVFISQLHTWIPNCLKIKSIWLHAIIWANDISGYHIVIMKLVFLEFTGYLTLIHFKNARFLVIHEVKLKHQAKYFPVFPSLKRILCIFCKNAVWLSFFFLLCKQQLINIDKRIFRCIGAGDRTHVARSWTDCLMPL